MKLWFVDDKQENHNIWARSFTDPIKTVCLLRSFYSVDSIVTAFEKGDVPDILFVDFFVGQRYGIDVIRWFDKKQSRPVLIAHSSLQQANDAMVENGADFALAKIKGVHQTESIVRVFKTIDDIEYTLKHHATQVSP